jgi:hypothetical protein
MATRNTYSSASAPPVSGPDVLDNLAEHIARIYNQLCLTLSGVAGTANVVTATLDPVLSATGMAIGMKFSITWALANTGGVTLALNGGTAFPVTDASGNALVAGALAAGRMDWLEWDGANFRVLRI